MGGIYSIISGPIEEKSLGLIPEPEADLPWIYAIRSPEYLDWKTGIKKGEISTIAKKQTQLPVPIGKKSSWLYLGDAKCARNIPLLIEKGITHIINCASQASMHYDLDNTYEISGITIMRINAEDEEGYPMLDQHLMVVERQITIWQDENPECKILVHCTAGINRSGVLVAALLLRSENLTVLEVVRHIRLKRGNCFLWNHSFQAQLVALARREGLLGENPCLDLNEMKREDLVARSPRRDIRELF